MPYEPKVTNTKNIIGTKPLIQIYGVSGSGKTYLIGVASKKLKTMMFDFEKGHITLEGKFDVDVFEVRDKNSWIFFNKAITQQNDFLEKYQLVAVDSVNGVYKLLTEMEIYDYENFKRKKDILYLQDRGKFINDIVLMVDHLKNLPKLGIVTCAAVTDKKGDTGYAMKPFLPGQLPDNINLIFDGYYYLEVIANPNEEKVKTDPVIRILHTQPTEDFAAKNRLGGVPPVLVANYLDVIRSYYKFLKESKNG